MIPRCLLTPFLLATGILAQQPADGDAIFGLDKMWDVHLTVSEADFESLYPQRTRSRNRSRSRFGYVQAGVRIGDRTLGDVGLRFKGQSTWSYSAGTLKRSFKLDFDRFVPGQTLLGHKKLNLNNNVTDPSQIREAVAYATYRAAGIPASRTAFARVFLTIPGVCEKDYLGMYTVIEQFDKRAMKRAFGSKKGLLVKPRTVLGYYGDTWSSRYDSAYDPKTEVQPQFAKPLLDLARLMRADDATFAAGLAAAMDVDQFLRYLGVTVILANTDSPLNLAHNYYLAVPKSVGKVVWIPWDLNLSLGGWGRAGPDQDRLSLVQPSRMRLVQRVFDVGTNEDRYRAIVAELIADPGSAAALVRRIATARRTAAPAIAKESTRSDRVTNTQRTEARRRDISRFGGSLALEEFVRRREASVKAQLAGTSEGIAGGTRLRGAPSSPPPVPLGARVRRALVPDLPADRLLFPLDDILAAGTATFGRLDQDRSGALDAAEFLTLFGPIRTDTPAYLQRRRARHARRLIRALDSNGDDSVAPDELAASIRRDFPTWDRDKNDHLSRRELRR